MMSPIPFPMSKENATLWRFEAERDGRPLVIGVLIRENGVVRFHEAGTRDELWGQVRADGWSRWNLIGGGVPEPAVTEQIAARYRPHVNFTGALDRYDLLSAEMEIPPGWGSGAVPDR